MPTTGILPISFDCSNLPSRTPERRPGGGPKPSNTLLAITTILDHPKRIVEEWSSDFPG